MLHIQESSPHSTLLLASMLSSPSVHPQPTASTSSRSTRVVEQLQDTLENLYHDLAVTRAQLESARQSKARHELDTQRYVESNMQYRMDIQELMAVLESKQEILDDTKRSSLDMESQVKKLKDEALASRQKLEELRRKEQVLEHDRDIAVAEKEQTERQQLVLKASVQGLASQFEQEIVGLRKELEAVRRQAHLLSEQSKASARTIETQIKQRVEARKELMQLLNETRAKMEANMQQFTAELRAQLEPLLESMRTSSSRNKTFEEAVLRCRGEVNGLVARIRAFTAEASKAD